MGELVAWIIGWDLILEYGVSVAAVAVGWGEYLNIFFDTVFGFSLPDSIAGPPGDGGAINLPAMFIVLAIMTLLVYGVRESARANSIMVHVKIAPRRLAKVHPRCQTPVLITVGFGIFIACIAAVVPLAETSCWSTSARSSPS